MTTKTVIFAISEYYNIPIMEAKKLYCAREKEDDFESIIEWYLNNDDHENITEWYLINLED